MNDDSVWILSCLSSKVFSAPETRTVGLDRCDAVEQSLRKKLLHLVSGASRRIAFQRKRYVEKKKKTIAVDNPPPTCWGQECNLAHIIFFNNLYKSL